MLLDLGEVIRYRGLGAGRVIDHLERDFRGERRVFAVVSFPHRDMNAQIPLGDPKIMEKLSRVADEADLREMLDGLSSNAIRLARTWDQREEHGTNVIRNGQPEEWAELLGGYARSRALDYAVSASDQEIVGQVIELLAAELSAASAERYEDCQQTVRACYMNTVETLRGELAAEAEPVAA